MVAIFSLTAMLKYSEIFCRLRFLLTMVNVLQFYNTYAGERSMTIQTFPRTF